MPPPRWPARCRCISESLPWTGRDAGRTRSSQASQWPRPSIPSSVRRTGLRLEASAWDGLSGGKCLGQDCLETNALDSIAWRQMAWTGQDSAIRREVTRSCCEQRSSASDARPVRATMLFTHFPVNLPKMTFDFSNICVINAKECPLTFSTL